jgi:hypothetical protein
MVRKCSPYHSTDLTDPRVYHDHPDCPNGRRIGAGSWVSGTGNLPRCGSCNRLD